jgi:hypothetical protein
LWVRPPAKYAARQARRKELRRRYGRFGGDQQFFDRMVTGDVVAALRDLKAKALAKDPASIDLYGDFVYWNCISHRSLEQMDSYAAMQMQEARSLSASDGAWFA